MGEVKMWLNLFYCKMEDAWTFFYLFILTQMKDFIVKKKKNNGESSSSHVDTCSTP
jgi:hypothetical protein